MSASKLDAVYRSIIITKFFTKGWGKPENLRRLFEFRKIISNRDECYKLVSKNYPVEITKEETWSDCHVMEGQFLSPMDTYMPGIVPECAKKAHFQVILPLDWKSEKFKPICLHLAGTGDHFFWRRRNLMAKPLLKEGGIGAIILENPFYGSRKPQDQVRSCLHNVSDIFVMGGCLILESLVLFHWCERNGLGPLGVTGLSMGGHMASLAATNWPKPLVLVPCLSWSTASPVFTQGVMAQSINWELLQSQYFSDGEYSEKLSKMVTIVDDAFLAGRKFAKSITSISNSKDKTTKTEQNDKSVQKFDNKNAIPVATVKKFTDKLTSEQKIKQVLLGVESSNQSLEKSALLEHLRLSNIISDSLYVKITAGEKFDLNEVDIKELNELNIKDKEISTLTNSVNPVKEFIASKYALNNVLLTKDINLPGVNNVDNIFKAKVQKEVYNMDVSIKESNEPNLKDMKISSVTNNSNRVKESTLSEGAVNNVLSTKYSNSTSTNNIDEIFKTKVREEVYNNISNKILLELDLNKNVIVSNNVENITKSISGKDLIKASDNKDVKDNNSRSYKDITMEILSSIPLLLTKGKAVNEGNLTKRKDREALQFMRGVMDECTHLSNFSKPVDSSLIIAVCAKNDAYVPQDSSRSLGDIWPGAEIRYVDAGHVGAYVLHQKLFRSSIIEAFERSKKKFAEEKQREK